MAFTNAWYLGNAELDGEGTCYCASLKSIPSILQRGMIAATTWSWPGIAKAFDVALLIDARGRQRHRSENLRGCVPLTIGVGANLGAVGWVDLAVPAAGGGVAAIPPTITGDSGDGHAETMDEPVRTIEARRHGRFMTDRRIGERVRAGEVVGALGNDAVAAPADGVLLGLPARGARIEPGDILVEVDLVRAGHQCYGIAAAARATAARVVAAIEHGASASQSCNTGAPEFMDSVVHEEYPRCAST